MVRVYFETENGGYAELVAVFNTEELYIACLPALEFEANAMGMIVTENVTNECTINLSRKA